MSTNKWLLAVGAAAAAIATGIMVTAVATAAPKTVYCLNGKSTTLPETNEFLSPSSTITLSSDGLASVKAPFPQYQAAYVLENSDTGLFYGGYDPARGGWFISADDPDGLASGYTTNYVALGACRAAAAAHVPSHVGVCKRLMRGDGTMGMFQDITVADWNNPNGPYYDAVAANWVEGMGLTCDNPVALGYKASGYNVAWGGKVDEAHNPGGVRASGFNNIYPYFSK